MNTIKKNNKYYFIKQDNKVCGIVGFEEFKGLKFTTLEGNTIISLSINGYPTYNIQYSTNGKNWSLFADSSTNIRKTVVLNNINDGVYFKGTYSNQNRYTGDYITFNVIGGKFAISGNIYSILDGDNFINITNLTQYESAFYNLFYGNTLLKDASNLVLQANILSDSCYYRMFMDCTSLISSPELPATTLASSCYVDMFNNCASLKNVYQLPATTLASQCYARMFKNCTSLEKAPELFGTVLKTGCYNALFDGCTNLNYMKIYYTGNFSIDNVTFAYWLRNTADYGTFYYNGNDTTYRGPSAIPSGWTVQPFS